MDSYALRKLKIELNFSAHIDQKWGTKKKKVEGWSLYFLHLDVHFNQMSEFNNSNQ